MLQRKCPRCYAYIDVPDFDAHMAREALLDALIGVAVEPVPELPPGIFPRPPEPEPDEPPPPEDDEPPPGQDDEPPPGHDDGYTPPGHSKTPDDPAADNPAGKVDTTQGVGPHGDD